MPASPLERKHTDRHCLRPILIRALDGGGGGWVHAIAVSLGTSITNEQVSSPSFGHMMCHEPPLQRRERPS